MFVPSKLEARWLIVVGHLFFGTFLKIKVHKRRIYVRVRCYDTGVGFAVKPFGFFTRSVLHLRGER